MRKAFLPFIVVFAVLILDQCLKFWVKTNMAIGDEFFVMGQDWFRIHFTENKGMAFGMELGGQNGKLILTLFRILAVTFIGYYIAQLVSKKAPAGLIMSFSLVLAGAIGNIMDSVFYGVIFSDSFGMVAEYMPDGGGYSSWFHGSVVDMLYFPLIINAKIPEWLPFFGGNLFSFFRPVFNIADAAITCGVISILIFFRSFFSSLPQDGNKAGEEISST